MTRPTMVFALAALALNLSACSGSGGGSSVPAPVACPTPPAITAVALVYPAPNSSGIPDNVGQVVIASASGPIGGTWNVVLSPDPAGFGATFQLTNPPFPSPNTPPTFANPTYQKSTFSQLLPGTTEQVFLNDTSSNCTAIGPYGQFTTQ